MIELFLKLIDYVIKLAGIQESNKHEYFDRYVQPAYETAELIYKDYYSMLSDLRLKVKSSKSPEPIIRILEERRRELLAARTRLRALIEERVKEGRATKFEAGILGLMSGAVTSVDRPYFRTYSYEESNGEILPKPGSHTVLDLIQKLTPGDGNSITTIRKELLKAIDDKMDGIEKAWENVVVGYAELHAGTLPQKVIKKHTKNRRLSGIPEVQACLAEIHTMLDSGRFDRETAINFEKIVADITPDLHSQAQEIREIIHDLDNKDPNITISSLDDCLARFERKLDRILKRKS